MRSSPTWVTQHHVKGMKIARVDAENNLCGGGAVRCECPVIVKAAKREKKNEGRRQ